MSEKSRDVSLPLRGPSIERENRFQVERGLNVYVYIFLKILFIYLFLEREEGRERNINV